jgi:hypothetical protein
MKDAAHSPDTLRSWKEIAAYLGRAVRTVQRWEAELGLPVQRSSGKGHAAVVARRSEIDAWTRRTSTTGISHKAAPAAPPGFDAGGFRFLMTEISCGLTFVSLAKCSRPQEREKYKRNVHNARKAYQTVLRFYGRITMSDEERTQLSAGLSRLEAELQDLGVLGGVIPQSAAAGSRPSRR